MGETGVEFITDTGLRISRKATPMVILITDGVGEENLGMMTVFCCHGQNKMEASDAPSALHQCDPPEPCVVVVRRYANTPYNPWGTSWLLYLDVSTLSGGASSIQFPLDHLCLWRLLPYYKTEVLLPHEEGEIGIKVYLYTSRGSMEKLWMKSTASLTHCQLLILFICSPSSSRRRQTDRGRTGLQSSPPAIARLPPGKNSGRNVS